MIIGTSQVLPFGFVCKNHFQQPLICLRGLWNRSPCGPQMNPEKDTPNHDMENPIDLNTPEACPHTLLSNVCWLGDGHIHENWSDYHAPGSQP